MNRENSYICIEKRAFSVVQRNMQCQAWCGFYNDDIDIIERHGAKVKVKCFPARKNKRARNREETLVICSYIYPAIRSATASEKADAYKYYYSAVGTAKKENTDVYKVCVNEC